MRKKLIVALLFIASGVVVLNVVAKKPNNLATPSPNAAVTTPAVVVPHKPAANAVEATPKNIAQSTTASHSHKTASKQKVKALAAHAKKHVQEAPLAFDSSEKANNFSAMNDVATDSPAQKSLNREIFTLCAASSQHPDPSVLKLALTAYNCAVATGAARPRTLTVIDYSIPSTQKRMWVFDLAKNRLLFNTYAAHGQGSGGVVPNYFSNNAQTHASSLGLFLTEHEYIGHEGYSLRLKGLEWGFNDRAESRNIVVHGAPYVSAAVARSGRLGRSWGCPAVPREMAVPIIDSIKGGNLVFSYYPDSTWLKKSKFLHCPVPATFMAAAGYPKNSVSAM